MNKILLEVIGLTYSHSQSGAYALILGEKGKKERIAIIIGEPEAQSIAMALEGYETKRPLTHDLFKSFATSFDVNVNEVVINRFKEGLFYSELHCSKDDFSTTIDARTSDAIAIAIRFKCPIYTYSQIIEEAGFILDNDDEFSKQDTYNVENDNPYENYDVTDLKVLLEEAIENEDYASASILRDEINKKKDN